MPYKILKLDLNTTIFKKKYLIIDTKNVIAIKIPIKLIKLSLFDIYSKFFN